MRKTVVSSLSLPFAVARESSAVAKDLGKSRSELFREAIEAYLRLYRFRKLQQNVTKAGAKRGVSAETGGPIFSCDPPQDAAISPPGDLVAQIFTVAATYGNRADRVIGPTIPSGGTMPCSS